MKVEPKALRKKADDLAILLKLSMAMTASGDLDSLLNLIMAEATRLVGADRSTLYLINEQTKELWSYIAQEIEIVEIRMPTGRGIAGYVARTGRTLNIKDAYRDPRFNPEIDERTGYRTRTILSVPMVDHEGKLVGVIEVLNKKKGTFTRYDESLLLALASQAAICIENARLHEDREKVFKSLIKALTAAIDARDPATAGHSERVTHYSIKIGRALGLKAEDMKILEYAAWLHDVGKIGIRDRILQKPKKLTKAEYEIIRQHPIYTREILAKIYFPDREKAIPLIASSHHESIDGSGYPLGLRGKKISRLSRIIACADVYDALTSCDRPYKKAVPIRKALKILKDGAGRYLDTKVVHTFIDEKLYVIERRQWVRVDTNVAIEYEMIPRGEPKKARTENISGGGLLFVSKEFIPLGSYMAVTVHLPLATIDVVAKVVRVEKPKRLEGYRIGICFIDLSNQVKERLSQYLVRMVR